MPVNSGNNNVINTRTNEFSAYAIFVVLFLANYFIHSSIYSIFLLVIAACLIIRYKPILMIVPCMLSDTLQGYFMITDTLSFNRALAILFVIGCFIHYRRIRITKFSFIPIILSLYLLASGLWSVTGSFNDAISFSISMAMLILLESIEDYNRNSLFKLFNFSFILYGISLALLTFIKAGGLNVSQVVFDDAFNANTICASLALSACIVYGSYSIGNGFSKIITYGYIGVCIVSILLIGSRTSLIGLVVSVLVTYIFANKHKGTSISPKKVLAFVIVIASIVAVLYFVMRNNPSVYYRFTFSSENRLDVASVTRRTEVWKALIYYVIPAHLFFGVGFGLLNVKTVVAPYVLYAKHAHNMFFAILSETGLVGLLLFLSFFIHYFVKIIKSKNLDRVFIIAILAFAFVNGIGEEMINQRWMWLSFGLCGLLLKSEEQREIL